MLEVTSISAGYGQIQVLWDASIQVKEKEIVALIGANGMGKSTLIKCITGMLKPQSGKVTFRGKDITGRPPHEINRSGIALVPEGRRLFSLMSVEENLLAGSQTKESKKHRAKNLEKIYTIFSELAGRKSQIAGTLSGGEQQMLAIGRALMSEPSLLILDEPSLGLSPKVFLRVLSVIKEIRETGISILLSEQSATQALKASDRAFVLQTGRVILSGRSSEVITNQNIREAYLGV
ncbi:MAG: ABC transporter ATP-binding protein [Nitrososphaerota archaeon]|nr:ABC transporter ATP-binding protein [Nitrososphaerota archaeon]